MNNLLRRVAVTGVGLECPLGNSFDELMNNLYAGISSVSQMPHSDQDIKLQTQVASLVKNFDEHGIPRQLRRSMSRVSQMAVKATEKALQHSGLPKKTIENERTGIAYGSTMGGTSALEKLFQRFMETKSFDGILSSSFLQIMSHTCGANIGLAFKIPGRFIASCTACAASTQAIGFGYEAIKFGLMDRMLVGGAEEFHPAIVGVFDSMRATSTRYNSTPSFTPRPFSKDRDGIVVGEGAGTLVLEDWDSAKARGANILSEIVGFHTSTDSSHMTNPSVEAMVLVMERALTSANLKPADISYVNAHGSGTSVGDVAESHGLFKVFGGLTPVSTLKGHFGHLMGACGVVESIACFGMQRDSKIVPTLHLTEIDPECSPLNFICEKPQNLKLSYYMKNSFAFGGVNASLIFKNPGEVL